MSPSTLDADVNADGTGLPLPLITPLLKLPTSSTLQLEYILRSSLPLLLSQPESIEKFLVFACTKIRECAGLGNKDNGDKVRWRSEGVCMSRFVASLLFLFSCVLLIYRVLFVLSVSVGCAALDIVLY